MATILVLEDDPQVQGLVRLTLTRAGHEVVHARSGEQALEIASGHRFDLAIIDNRLPGISGLETFRRLRQSDPLLPGIVVTGYASVPNAVEAIRTGIVDYLPKPFTPRELTEAVERALVKATGAMPAHIPAGSPTASPGHSDPWIEKRGGFPGFDDIVGDCPAMREIFRLIPRFAATSDPILIVGDTGTGKELVARAIHRHSPRANAPFVDINCAAIPMTLFESELFGHERGAFTDGREARPGKFEQAHRGTLFLDEIGEMPLDAQAKLLRAVELREITRLGGARPTSVDVRIVAATNADLENLVARGIFRRDLYYRLEALVLSLPPLRNRDGDISVLIDYLFDQLRREHRFNHLALSDAARQALMRHEWPGNVRELGHLLRRAIASATTGVLDVVDLPRGSPAAETGSGPGAVPAAFNLVSEAARVTAEYEVRQIRSALAAFSGNRTRAARALGIDARTLYTKLIKLGIDSDTA